MPYLSSISSGFLLGIVVSSLYLSDATLLFCIIVSLLLFLEAYFFERDHVRKVGFVISFLFLGIFLGQFRVLAFNHFISHDLQSYEGQNVSVLGKIISEPVSNGQTQKFTVDISEVKTNNQFEKISENVLVTTELFPGFHYGDILLIKGQIKKPEKVIEDDGRIFDYPSYLLKDKITETISFGLVKPLSKNEGNPLIKFLYGIKESLVGSMQKVLPEPEAGLLAGIVLGTQTLSENLSNDFRVAGLSHIVVLSGYNITIVADSAMAVALFFAPAYASFVAVFCVVLFVLMSGFGASALRAGIMAVVALLGKRFGKTYDAGRALFFAGFIMIIWNPMTLLYDPSFHLSFLATVAMIYFSPIVFSWLKFITDKYGLKETFATTLAVNIFVLPYILYMSGSIQIFSLPANMLVLPFVSVTMFLGLLVSIFGFFGRFIGLIIGVPSYIILYYDIFIAQTISHLPFARISFSHFSVWFMVVIYLGFSYFLYKKNHVVELSSLHGMSNEIITEDVYLVIEENEIN